MPKENDELGDPGVPEGDADLMLEAEEGDEDGTGTVALAFGQNSTVAIILGDGRQAPTYKDCSVDPRDRNPDVDLSEWTAADEEIEAASGTAQVEVATADAWEESPTDASKPTAAPAAPGKSAELTAILGAPATNPESRIEAALKPTPSVPFSRRKTVLAVAALGILGAIGMAGMKAKETWEAHQIKPETKDLVDQKPQEETPTKEIKALPEETISSSNESPTVLYARIGTEVEKQTASSNLSEGAKGRILAASSNTLTESLYTGNRWENLDGKWLDTTAAHQNVVGKLQTWGGYTDVLTVSAGAQNIDEMLEKIANSSLPHSELVAWKVATQIASIQDKEVVPSVETVQTNMSTITSDQIEEQVKKNIKNPPPIPAPSIFAGMTDSSAQLDEDLSEDLEFLPSAPTFEDRFDVIEPANLKPGSSQPKEAFEEDLGAYLIPEEPELSPFDAPEPKALLAKLPDVTEHLVTEVEVEEEEDEPEIAAPTKPEPTPAPSFVEQAKTAINSLASKFKSWWS